MTEDSNIPRAVCVFFALVMAIAITGLSGRAGSQEAPKPAMAAWLRCIQGNSFSEVEKTPERAVEIAFENCRKQEDNAIGESFSEEQLNANFEMIRTRLRDGLRATFVTRVIEDRQSDPELHAPFAEAVKEDEDGLSRGKSKGLRALPVISTPKPSVSCDLFQTTALTRPNQLSAFIRASGAPALGSTLAGSTGPFKIDFAKDEFVSTSVYNTDRQSRWLALLAGGRNLVVRKMLNPNELKYDADRGIMVVEIGSEIFDPLRRDAEGVYFQIDFKVLKESTRFKGGAYESLALELSSDAIGKENWAVSGKVELSMGPDAARNLKENGVLAFEVSLPIADDAAKVVMYHDVSKIGEKFPDDPRGSLFSRRSFPVNVSCGALFAGNQFVAQIGAVK